MTGSSASSGLSGRPYPKNGTTFKALAGLGAAATVLLLVALFSQFWMRADLNEDMDVVLREISEETADTTNQFLIPADSATRFLADWLQNEAPVTSQTSDLQPLLESVLVSNEHFAGAFVGYPNGDFLFARHDLLTGGFAFKEIRAANSALGQNRFVEIATFDRAGSLVATTNPSDDTYDPRERPWFTEAVAQGQAIWTEPYSFATTGERGVTRAVPLLGEDGAVAAIVGIDVRVADLSEFVANRSASEHGTTFIIDGSGSLVAHPNLFASAPSSRTPNDPLLGTALSLRETAPVSASNMTAPSISQTDVNGTATGFAIASLDQAPEWSIVVSSPTSDFLSSARDQRTATTRLALFAGVMLAALAGWLLGLLILRLRRFRQAATTDFLTGLSNRQWVTGELDTRIQAGTPFAVAILDIDRFKAVNDSRGHEGGDQLLCSIGERLQTTLGSRGQVARLGGDEFLLILTEFDDDTSVRTIAEEVRHALTRTFIISGAPLSTSISIGVSEFRRDVHRKPGQLLSEADLALYASKGAGGNHATIFDRELESLVASRRRRRDELHKAATGKAFSLAFQPEFALATGKLIGVEALLRWEHPEYGILPAETFLEDLQTMSLMDRLTQPVFDQAAAFAERWNDDSAATVPLRMRINLSAQEVLAHNLIPIVEQSGILNHCLLILEIREETLSHQDPSVLLQLNEMRRLGIRIAVDNFGSGSASLSALYSMPVDMLKVERSHISAIAETGPARSIAKLILTLGQSAGLEVSGGGIESLEQHHELLSLGCTSGQGHLLGTALPAQEFLATWGSSLSVSVRQP